MWVSFPPTTPLPKNFWKPGTDYSHAAVTIGSEVKVKHGARLKSRASKKWTGKMLSIRTVAKKKDNNHVDLYDYHWYKLTRCLQDTFLMIRVQ